MTFLAPLFLLGALAIAGPIIFHLIRRTTKEHTPFSSLMFLKPTPPRVTRRSRLENLWLLLLRCLVILLLALGFARPLYQKSVASPVAPDASKRSIILVDASASMRRGDLWKQALERAEWWIKKAVPGDEIAVLTFARGVESLMTFEQWRNAPIERRADDAFERLKAMQPSWSATPLGPALLQAAELLDSGQEATGLNEVILISDLQEGAKLDGLQGFAWPKRVQVVVDAIGAAPLENASAQWLANSSATADAAETIRLRVQSAPSVKKEQFKLEWQPAEKTSAVNVYLPAGQARIAHVPAPPVGAEKLILSGDGVDFDNTLHILKPEPHKTEVVFIGKDLPQDAQGALYYLNRGFPPTRLQTVEVMARSPETPPRAFELQRADLMVLGEGLTERVVSLARDFANSGKVVLYPVPSASAGPALGQLLEIPKVELKEAQSRGYALFGQIDFTHPVFSPFADPRYSDFTKIHFWKHREIKPDALPRAKVLARFDDQTPALLQVPIGKGCAVILMTTWRPADSQLALSSKFVPLLHSLLEQSTGAVTRQPQYFVGDAVPLPPGAQPLKIRTPSGREIEQPAGATFTATDEPGIYGTASGDFRFVVNLSPEESRLAALDPGRLSTLGVPVQMGDAAASVATVPNPAAIQAAEVESRQKLWRWLLLAGIVVLLLETPIAARLSQPSRQPVS